MSYMSHIQSSAIFSTLFSQVYAHIFKHIQSYWDICTHKAYSGLFRQILDPVQPSNIKNLAIFWGLPYLEPEAYLKLGETLNRHIQKPATGHYSAKFRHTQSLVQCLHKQKPGILGILKYSRPFWNCIPAHIQNPAVSTKVYKYSEL